MNDLHLPFKSPRRNLSRKNSNQIKIPKVSEFEKQYFWRTSYKWMSCTYARKSIHERAIDAWKFQIRHIFSGWWRSHHRWWMNWTKIDFSFFSLSKMLRKTPWLRNMNVLSCAQSIHNEKFTIQTKFLTNSQLKCKTVHNVVELIGPVNKLNITIGVV